TTFLTCVHNKYLKHTTRDDYLRLKRKRGLPSQTFKGHGLAYAPDLGFWLVPFKNPKGNVITLMRYWPDKAGANKLIVKGLPSAIYGFDKLMAADNLKTVLICEGPFDAMALGYSIGPENRGKYVIVATPGAFKDEWAEHFRGRKVRAFY